MANYADIHNTSKTAVVNQLRQIKASGALLDGSLISGTNLYRVVDTPQGADSPSNIAEYAAASCLTHLYDGWNYLSAALRAFIRNDVGVCGHNGYYAELRAALSLLSTNGIIICRSDGLYLKSDSTVNQLYSGDGTHVAVWEALKAYAQLPSTTSDKVKVDKLIEVEGATIADWIMHLSGACSSRTMFNSLLLDCGADLERYSKDKNGRSKYSYSPTALEHYKLFPEEEIRDKVVNFWDLFEPIGLGRFGKIDMYILQSMCERHKNNIGWNERDYENSIRAVINRLAAGDAKDLIFEKLCRRKIELPFALDVDGGDGSEDLHCGILMRACFMLRLATASCRELLQSAGITNQDLDIWLKQCQKLRFMWQAPVSNYSYNELWADIDDSVTSLDTYAPVGNETWLETEARSLEVLSRTEYIMLWGLGL